MKQGEASTSSTCKQDKYEKYGQPIEAEWTNVGIPTKRLLFSVQELANTFPVKFYARRISTQSNIYSWK